MASLNSALSESEKKFLEFNWAESREWQSYYDSLFPTPPLKKLLKWKKKFYRANIDSLFDINSTNVDRILEGSAPPTEGSTFQGTPTRPTPNINRTSTKNIILCGIAFTSIFLGLICSIFSGIVNDKGVSLIGTLLWTVGFISRIISCCGTPGIQFFPFSQLRESLSERMPPYLQMVMLNDATHALVFLCFTGALPPSLPLIISPAITSCLLIAQMLREGSGIPTMICKSSIATKIVQTVETKRYVLLQLRADVEVLYLIFFLLLNIVTLNISLSNLLLPGFLLFQLTKIRYQTCPFSQCTMRRLDGFLNVWLSHRLCPKIIYTIYQKVRQILQSQVAAAT